MARTTRDAPLTGERVAPGRTSTRTRYRFFSSVSREETWLTEMAAQGWYLTWVNPALLSSYHFTRSTSGSTAYRIDYRRLKSQEDFTGYTTLFADAGWHLVYGNRYSHWWALPDSGPKQYFVRLRPDADPEIFSDDESRAQSYRRAAWAALWSLLSYATFLILLVLFAAISGSGPIRDTGAAAVLGLLAVSYVIRFLLRWRAYRRLTGQ